MVLDQLRDYGTSFQIKVIAILLQPKATPNQILLIDRVIDFLEVDYFETEQNKILVKIIKSHYEKYKVAPDREACFLEIKKMGLDEILRYSVLENYKKAIDFLKTGDFQYIEDQFQDFCKTRALINAILKSADYISTGNTDLVKPLIDNAMKITSITDFGTMYESTVDERLSDTARDNVCETPWPALNEVMSGGIGAGNLGCIIAPSGAGKTWLLSALGLHGLRIGKNVLHITLELGDNYVNRRYDSILTGIPDKDLKYHADTLKHKIFTDIKGKLITKQFPTKSLTVHQIRSYINSLLSINFKPDLIILDYADLLSPEVDGKRVTSSYEDGGNIYEYLRGLSGEFAIPIWTASQANRGGEKNKVLTNSDVADSYKKIFTSDFVLTLSRNKDDKASNIARLFLSKNRYGVDGVLFPAKFDTDHGIIDLYTEESTNGKMVMKEAKKALGTADKKMLSDVNEEVKNEALNLKRVTDGFVGQLENPIMESLNLTPKDFDPFDEFIDSKTYKKSKNEFELNFD